MRNNKFELWSPEGIQLGDYNNSEFKNVKSITSNADFHGYDKVFILCDDRLVSLGLNLTYRNEDKIWKPRYDIVDEMSMNVEKASNLNYYSFKRGQFLMWM